MWKCNVICITQSDKLIDELNYPCIENFLGFVLVNSLIGIPLKIWKQYMILYRSKLRLHSASWHNFHSMCHNLITPYVCQLKAVGTQGHLQHYFHFPHYLSNSNYNSQPILEYCVAILNFSDIRISIHCCICDGGDVICTLYFMLRPWVPIAALFENYF